MALDILKPTDPNVSRETLTHVPIGQVADNPWQYRTLYGALEELAADIERNGLLQPPIARLAPDGSGTYQIAFGHRRLRACRLAGMVNFPLFVHLLSDEEMAEYAWSENEKRSDASPIEKARHIQRVQADFAWTQEQVGVRFGINRSTAANLLRLLELPQAVQTQIDSGALPARSGMLLLRLADAPETLAAVAETAATTGQTTREIETAIAEQRQRIDAEAEKSRQMAAVDGLGLGVEWIESGTNNTSVFYSGNWWADSLLLEGGQCGPGVCDCLRLWYRGGDKTLPRTAVGPLVDAAPDVFWACCNDPVCRDKRSKIRLAELSASTEQHAAQREESGRAAALERERRAAIAEGIIDATLQRWPVDEVWGDLRFWRFVAAHAGYELRGSLDKALNLADAYRRLLVASLVQTEWTKEYGNVIDLAKLSILQRELYKVLGDQETP